MAPPAPLSRRTTALLALLAAAAFAPALANAPIGDTAGLLARVRFASTADWLGVFGQSYWGDFAPGSGGYRPLALLWLGAERRLLGAHHGAMLAVGLALHAAGVALAHRVLLRLVPAATATGAAIVAAVHPIAAEAVITVYGQVDALAALLATAALRLHLGAHERRGALYPALAAGVTLAALLVKESAVVTPLLAWLASARLTPEGRSARRWRPDASIAAMAVSVAAGVALRFLVLGGEAMPTRVAVSGAETPGERLQLVLVSLGTALRLLVLPVGQTIYYGHLRESVLGGAGAEAAWVVGFVALAGWLRGRPSARDVRFGLGWLALALLPVMSIVPIGFLAAERALYLPRIGFAVAVAAFAAAASERLAGAPVQRRRALAGLAAVALGLGVGLSWRVARHWRDPVSLWEHTLRWHPRSPKAHAAYTLALLAAEPRPDAALLERARFHAVRCGELNPGSEECAAALAIVREREAPDARPGR